MEIKGKQVFRNYPRYMRWDISVKLRVLTSSPVEQDCSKQIHDTHCTENNVVFLYSLKINKMILLNTRLITKGSICKKRHCIHYTKNSYNKSDEIDCGQTHWQKSGHSTFSLHICTHKIIIYLMMHTLASIVSLINNEITSCFLILNKQIQFVHFSTKLW